MLLEFEKPFTMRTAKFLLANNMYNYFSINVYFGVASNYSAGIYFLNHLEPDSAKQGYLIFMSKLILYRDPSQQSKACSPHLFNEVKIGIDRGAVNNCDKFIKLYKSKGFNENALKYSH